MIATFVFIILFFTFFSRIATKIRKAFAEIEGLPTAQPVSTPQQSETAPEEVEYFTYEKEMSDIAYQPAEEPQRAKVVEPVFTAVSTPVNNEVEGFDLRKAVIYEAILSNPYKG